MLCEEVSDGGVCTVKAKSLFVAVSCVSLLLPIGVSLGDGGMFFHEVSYQDVLQPTQKVYIRWDGSQETLLIQTKYQGPAGEMVWIVPVPSEPTVETADGTVFEDLGEKTDWPDLSYTSFPTSTSGSPFGIHLPIDPLASGTFSAGGGTSVVQWQRRIGAYEVVLLRPVGGEDVIQWLNNNGFALPQKAAPILEDYLRNGWWMVASRIDQDALSSITQEKLANGTLNPLQMTFSSSTCLYPMRLTSLAAGPVEELIYIEGPRHYVPQTLSDGPWQIDIFGGPIRQVPQYHYQSDVELAIEVLNGRTQTKYGPHLTKLHRVFQPEEMTQDLLFAPWITRNGWTRQIRETRCSSAKPRRSTDGTAIRTLFPTSCRCCPPGILDQVRPGSGEYQAWPSLYAKILSAYAPDSFDHWRDSYLPDGSGKLSPTGEHVYSLIWALGEIGVEHKPGSEVEDLLLQCAQHDNQLVRMEAYVALTKLQSEKLGPILADRLAYIPNRGPFSDSAYDPSVWALACEMNIVADWVTRFGTASQKEALVKALTGPLATLGSPGKYAHLDPQHPAPTTLDWFDWVVWLAAGTQDGRLIAPLQDLYTRLAGVGGTGAALAFIQRAQAACDATEAAKALVGQMGTDEAKTLAEGGGPTVEGMTSLSSYFQTPYYTTNTGSLRVQILQRHWWRYELYPMPSEVGDEILRSALSERTLGDWYALYVLAGIKEPQAADKDRLTQIWDKGDPWVRVGAVDVLYTWNDGSTLLALHDSAESEDVRAEIAWALADLGIAQALPIVEERATGSWNKHWQDCSRPFLVMTWDEIDKGDPNLVDAIRQAQAIQTYFHPNYEELDEERLAALGRLGDNSAIHPGLRFDLFLPDYAARDLVFPLFQNDPLVPDYGANDWALPLFQKAVRDVLEAYPLASTVTTILERVDVHFVVDACGEFSSDTPRQTLLLDLLGTGSYAFLPTIEGLLEQVWPQRYTETQGQSPLFREPGDLAASINYYCAHCTNPSMRSRSSGTTTNSPIAEPVLASIVKDDTLPAGYRAFLLVYWPAAPKWISQDFAESLLAGDVPDFIREALQKRMENWQ